MSVYFIAQIKIKDQEEYKLYEDGFNEIFTKYDGRVVVVDNNPTVLEGDWRYTRTVMIRFPDEEKFKSWYESAEYQKLARHRFQASDGDVILVKGRD